jgi:hypothetical protein
MGGGGGGIGRFNTQTLGISGGSGVGLGPRADRRSAGVNQIYAEARRFFRAPGCLIAVWT